MSTTNERTLEGGVEALLPHRGIMLRLDALASWDEEGAQGRFLVKATDPFVEDGVLAPEAVIETLAQTVAAWQGALALAQGQTPALGFLTGMEALVFSGRARVGDTITTNVRLERGFGAMKIQACEAHVDENTIAQGSLKFFLEAPSER